MNEQFAEDFESDDASQDEVGTPETDTTEAGTPVDVAALEHRLLAHLQNPNYRPVKPRVIAKKLGLSEVETRELRRLVKKLVRRGQIVYGANHLIGPASAPPPKTTKKSPREERYDAEAAGAESSEEVAPEAAGEVADDSSANENQNSGVAAKRSPAPAPERRKKATEGTKSTGRADRLAAQAGRPLPGVVGTFRRHQAGFGFVRPLSNKGTDRAGDIFILADDAADAATGDTVRVKVSGERYRGKNQQGRIVEVIERQTHQFVGTYFEAGGGAFVQVDGTLFAQPIAVGDPGAKNAQQDDKVVFEMVRFPTYWASGEGVITEVLGKRGEPGIDTLSIIREFQLPEAFPDDVVEDSRRQADMFDETELGERLDFTAETVVTIDPVDARDFDDAISLTKLDNGHWRLGVHIADVSHFVRPKSPLDREARERATSVYLPDRVIPMIPEVISNGLASLQPDRVRFVKTAFLEFTPEGVRTHIELKNAAIRSKRRFAYEEIDDYLADRKPWQAKLTPEVFKLVGDMHELAMILRGRRIEKGALELTMREVKVDLDKQGRVAGAHRVENTVSHQIIEEFMLAANMAVAETIAEAEWFFLRRIHEAPDPKKLKLLESFVESLGLNAEGLESRFELQRLLKEVHGRPEEQAINYALLRSLQRARYAPNEDGHYALASDCYCHFTSPIRRYPDLTIHRLFDALIKGKKPRNDFDELASLGEHCSDRERRAEAAERELTKVKLLTYLSDRIGEELDAVVTGVEEFGLFAQGVEFPAEGMIRVDSLADDFYHYERSSHSLTGRRAGNAFRLGDKIRVAVVRVDVDRRELDFRVVDRFSRPRGGKPAKSRDGQRREGQGRDGPRDERRGGRGHGDPRHEGKKSNQGRRRKR
ncbi:MAG: ribonuclease R [Planctomycetales bacterium]|nr:ribonuclease R [Planctomycetales bacterium]MBN8627322.1 ribonuclease R [Planctomycetota bacterium]